MILLVAGPTSCERMRSRISHLLYLLVNYVLLVEFLVILNHKDFFLNFMHWLKSAILAIFQFWQNGTFEPVYEIQKLFRTKDFF